MRSRLLVCSLVAFIVLYIVKVWLLYVLLELMGFVEAPEDDFGQGGDELLHSSLTSGAGAVDLTRPNSDLSAAYRAAVQAYRDGKYREATEALKGCDAEDLACVSLQAELRLVGIDDRRNLTEAIAQFKSAAEQGDLEAQFALGVLYSNLFEGDPAEMRRSEALAILYFYAASVAGHPGALMAMGYRHSQGYGVPKTCNTAALNYIEVARKVAEVYSAGMPQAVELVRLGVEGGERKAMSAAEVSLFVVASNSDPSIAAAVGKRYLLGIEGFRQNYKRAAHHLQIAADKNHGNAMALLGYMYCLGLGVPKSLELAYSYFRAAAAQHDALGHNGMGFIFFHGIAGQHQDWTLALQHFNESAYRGSADGMFNLASLYLTGTGTEQSFQRATLWYTQALDRGHTPAAYTLAVMHLNGVGTMRNCKIAVDLLKRVCERGSWVSQKLQEAYDRNDEHPESAAWLFLRLAEAGHEVAQMNVAHLFDSGTSHLLSAEPSGREPTEEARHLGKVFAQRHYEMSAEQGNALSELRLGDYAYYGWGLRADTTGPELVDGDVADEQVLSDDVRFTHQEADPELSVAHYKRTSSMRIMSEWMQPFVARASFNLGYMYQFGVGVPRDIPLARRYYRRCFEVHPDGVQAPMLIMLGLLAMQVFWLEMPTMKAMSTALLADMRTHILAVQIALIVALLRARSIFANRLATAPGPRATPVLTAAAAARMPAMGGAS